MKQMIALALILVVFMFATTIAASVIRIFETCTLNRPLTNKKYIPTGDPIDGPQPPGFPMGAGN